DSATTRVASPVRTGRTSINTLPDIPVFGQKSTAITSTIATSAQMPGPSGNRAAFPDGSGSGSRAGSGSSSSTGGSGSSSGTGGSGGTDSSRNSNEGVYLPVGKQMTTRASCAFA